MHLTHFRSIQPSQLWVPSPTRGGSILRCKQFEPTAPRLWLLYKNKPQNSGATTDVRRTALRLILVSNRVAIPTESGAHRAGGLEVVLAPTLKRYEGVWFGWSGNVVPRAQVTTKTIEKSKQSYVLTDLAEEDYQEYYGGFANRVLWPILHYRIDLAEFTRRDLTGYLRVNQHFADELSKVIRPSDLIWVHDYHFIPLGDELRKRGHSNRIGFFLHVPFPAPEFITVLPRHERLLSSLLQYDLVGFQTEGDVQNFVRYVLAENRGSNIRTLLATDRQVILSQDGRNTRVGSFPVGIDTGEFERLARRAAQSSFVREVVEKSWGANIADRRRSARLHQRSHSADRGVRPIFFRSPRLAR